jgi:hypothetical protein
VPQRELAFSNAHQQYLTGRLVIPPASIREKLNPPQIFRIHLPTHIAALQSSCLPCVYCVLPSAAPLRDRQAAVGRYLGRTRPLATAIPDGQGLPTSRDAPVPAGYCLELVAGRCRWSSSVRRCRTSGLPGITQLQSLMLMGRVNTLAKARVRKRDFPCLAPSGSV